MVQWLQGGVTKNTQHGSVFRGWQCTSEHKTQTRKTRNKRRQTFNWQIIVMDTTTVWRVETAVRAEVYHWYG